MARRSPHSHSPRRQSLEARSYVLWDNARQRARRAGHAFAIDRADIERRVRSGRCEVTGLPFAHAAAGYRKAHPWAPSIDRIDPTEGYTPENTRIVVWMLNACKHEAGDAEVATFCEAFLRARH
jgi:hypothetical protein